jgi:hypothetical protein
MLSFARHTTDDTWWRWTFILNCSCAPLIFSAAARVPNPFKAILNWDVAVAALWRQATGEGQNISVDVAKLGADKFDASFVRIDDLPMFNQDLEGNLPEEAVRFKSELANTDGVLIVTPEHDRSIPALLKNAVDWGARPYGENSWAGKPGFITGTSPGAISSALAQQHLRSVMVGLGMGWRGICHVQAGPRRRRGRHR